MSLRTRRAPSSAKRTAMASPIPAPTPVTMATLSFRRKSSWPRNELREELSAGHRGQIAVGNDTVDHAIVHRHFRTHDVVAIHIPRHLLHRLSAGFGEDG